LAFGGAGALHVAELAARLGAARALVPPDPGLLSAYGMLAAPRTREASRTVLAEGGEEAAEALLAATFAELEALARTELLEEGADADALAVERWVDARYRGQSFELRVPKDGWLEAFHRAHEERYGYARRGAPVEAVTLRVVASAPGPRLDVARLEAAVSPPAQSRGAVCLDGREVEVARVWRRDLRAGHTLEGPAIVQEYSATTWVPPEWSLEVDAWGILHLVTPGSP
jgi:N-methylhydantoinase A